MLYTSRSFFGFISLCLALSGCQKTTLKSTPQPSTASARVAPVAPAVPVIPAAPLPPPRTGEPEPLDPVIVAPPPPLPPPIPVTPVIPPPPPRTGEPEPRDPAPPPPPSPTPQPPPAPNPIIPQTPPAPPSPPLPNPILPETPANPPPAPPPTTPPPVPQTIQPPPVPSTPVPVTPPPQPVSPQTPPNPPPTTVIRGALQPTSVTNGSGLPANPPLPRVRPRQAPVAPPATGIAAPPAPKPAPATPVVVQQKPVPPPPPPLPRFEPKPGTCQVRPMTTVHTVTDQPKLDVLFVVDTSSSLVRGSRNTSEGGELARLASEMPHFVNSLPKNTNLRIGVLPAHGPESAQFARLLRSPGGVSVLDSTRMSPEQMWKALRSMMSNIPPDRAPGAHRLSDSQGEAMLLTLFTAVSDPAKRGAIKNSGLFRPDASLAVIIVSDEQDICYTYPVDTATYRQADEDKFRQGLVPVLKKYEERGGRTVLEPDRKEVAAKARFCAKNGKELNADVVAAKLRRLEEDKLTQKVILNAITYLTNEPPLKSVVDDQDENEMGHGIIDLHVAMGTGEVADMAQVRQGGQVSFVQALAQLGASTRTQIEYNTVWDCYGSTIHPGAINPDSVRVTVLNARADELSGWDETNGLSPQGDEVARFSSACQGGRGCQHADGGVKVDTRQMKTGGFIRVTPANPATFERVMKSRGVKSAKYRIDFETLRDVEPATGRTSAEVQKAMIAEAAKAPKKPANASLRTRARGATAAKAKAKAAAASDAGAGDPTRDL